MKQFPIATSADVRSWIRGIIRTNVREFSIILILLGLASSAGLVGPQILGYLVNLISGSVNGDVNVARIDLLAGLFVMSLLFSGVLKWFAETRARRLSERVLADTREKLVRNALTLPLDTVEAAGTGDLLNRSTTNIDEIDYAVRVSAPETLIASISVVFTIAAMIATSPVLALGLLPAFPLMIGILVWYLRRSPAVVMHGMDLSSIGRSNLYETTVGAHTVEALSLADKRISVHQQIIERFEVNEKKQQNLVCRYLLGLSFSYVIPFFTILLLGGWMYAQGWAELGKITTVLLYAQMFAGSMRQLIAYCQNIFTSEVSLRRILGVQASDAKSGFSIKPNGQDIAIQNVYFGYSSDREVLHDINLNVPQGERLAIVGPSGAGKSTLARLLAGVAVPTTGSVHIGGVEVSELASDVLRGEVLLLTQEHHIFAGTLRDNLTLVAGQWTDDKLMAALMSVGAEQWARRLPQGLDTELGSGAYSVPAAMAQQIALARVVLADPHTIVLDEATSLLDVSSARELESSLNSVLAGRTVIAIAHRLHTAAAADRIVVMEHGRVVELGSHEELCDTKGPYSRLVRAASSGVSAVVDKELVVK